MSGDVHLALTALVSPMREHLHRLDGDLDSANAAAGALTRAGQRLDGLRADADRAGRDTLHQWYGERSGEFGDRVAALTKALTDLRGNVSVAAEAAWDAVAAVEAGRRDIDSVIKGFIDRATPRLREAAVDDGRWTRVLGELHATAGAHATETAGRLKAVRGHLDEAAGRLSGLDDIDQGVLSALGEPLGAGGGPGGVTAQGTVAAPARDTVGDPAPTPGGGTGGGGDTGTGGGGAHRPHLPVAVPPQPGSGVDVNLPGGATVQAPDERAAAAVRKALSALGTPYVWAAADPPRGTDCSGLTMWAYADTGLTLPRHSAAQAVGAEVTSMDQLLPGDLIVWRGHVAMCVGNGQLIEAGDPVQIGPVRTTNSGMPFIGFYRPTG